MLSSTVSVETPEGIELQLPVAGLVVRALAWVIDFCARMMIYFILIIVAGFIGISEFFNSFFQDSSAGYVIGISSIVYFLFEWFFTTVPEAMYGTTPGKKAMGLRVVHTDGTPLSWGSAVMRNFLRFADFLPFLYFTAVVSMLIDNRSRRLGDLAAGSMVVHHSKQHKNSAKQTSHQPVVPPMALTQTERSAILDFDERCEALTEERQIELAQLLGALGVGTGKEAVDTIRSWAQWVRSGSGVKA